MFREGYFKLAIVEEPKIKVIELPYLNNELSMLILLPEVVHEDFTGLEQVIPSLLSSYIWKGMNTEQYSIAPVWSKKQWGKQNLFIFSFHSLQCYYYQ